MHFSDVKPFCPFSLPKQLFNPQAHLKLFSLTVLSTKSDY